MHLYFVPIFEPIYLGLTVLIHLLYLFALLNLATKLDESTARRHLKSPRLLSVRSSHLTFQSHGHIGGPGLDTYFFLNLSVGQPSNNMDLSEIEIYLGTMMIFFLFTKKNRRELYICIFNFYFKITVSESHCHILNHWCSSVEIFSVHFDVTGTRNTFQWI